MQASNNESYDTMLFNRYEYTYIRTKYRTRALHLVDVVKDSCRNTGRSSLVPARQEK